MFVAIALTVTGLVWFVLAQLRPERAYTVLPPGAPEASGAVEARPDEATEDPATEGKTADEAADNEAADDKAADDKAAADQATADEDTTAGDTGIAATRSEE